jgi:predicted DNA-binding transcriptional regulator YafY
MYHPSTRLLTILELLQARGRISGPELARRLEVSPRSVRRYIAMLQDMGIPIETERGRYGRYLLRPGYKLPPLMLSDDEALAVTLGLLLVRLGSATVDHFVVEGALAKLDRILPERLRHQLEAVQASLVVDTSTPGTPPVGAQVLTISRGIDEHRRIWLRHHTHHGGMTEREFDPYALVHRDGLWYTLGYCHLRQDVRIFRLDRITAVELRPQTFTPPENFDPLSYFHQKLATIPSRWFTRVLLKTTLDDARRRIAPTMAILEPVEEGVMMHCTTDSLDWLARELAGLGCAWVVLDPPELKDALRALAERILAAV